MAFPIAKASVLSLFRAATQRRLIQGYVRQPLYGMRSFSTSKTCQSRRICFTFKVTTDPSLLGEYKEAHKNVWPEMQEALQRQGWHQYSLFLRPDGLLVGIFESDRSLAECVDGMEAEEINAVWQKAMQKYFPANQELRPDEQMVQLEEIMFLDL